MTTATSPVLPIQFPLTPLATFNVLGEQVDILLSTAQTAGACTVLCQTSPPNGGPPPHVHQHEDELFQVLEGEYKLLVNGEWRTLRKGEMAFAPRGIPHTFNNRSTTTAKMLCVALPGNFQHYLEKLSALSAPQDMPKILALSAEYGITFLL